MTQFLIVLTVWVISVFSFLEGTFKLTDSLESELCVLMC